MKLKNISSKIITINGIHFLPNETHDIDSTGNEVVNFFVQTGRLSVVPTRGVKRAAEPSVT